MTGSSTDHPRRGAAFVVEELAANHHLLFHSREHLPPGWAQRFGASIDWTWAFVLSEVDPRHTRLILRSRMRVRPWWVTAFYLAVIVPADFVMSRQMLRGVKARAETTGARAPALQAHPALAVGGPSAIHA